MAISGLALKVYTAYKDAPGDYKNISDEVESLLIIIIKAAQHFEGPALSDNCRQEGQTVLSGCQNVLEDLDALIEKYNSLGPMGTGQVLQRFKLSASLVLGTEDIATLRARLTSNTTLLTGFIQRFAILTITIRYIMLMSFNIAVNFINLIKCNHGWIVFSADTAQCQETLLFPLLVASTSRRPTRSSANAFSTLVSRQR